MERIIIIITIISIAVFSLFGVSCVGGKFDDACTYVYRDNEYVNINNPDCVENTQETEPLTQDEEPETTIEPKPNLITYWDDTGYKKTETSYYASNGFPKVKYWYDNKDWPFKNEVVKYYESNGNEKIRTFYLRDGETKFIEKTYHESNGAIKTYISYNTEESTEENRVSKEESTYYESGGFKTHIKYDSYGSKESGYPACYHHRNRKKETCIKAKHGCTSKSNTCITDYNYE